MIRPYKTADRDKLLEIFKSYTPQYFAVNEIIDFKEYLEKNHSYYFSTSF